MDKFLNQICNFKLPARVILVLLLSYTTLIVGCSNSNKTVSTNNTTQTSTEAVTNVATVPATTQAPTETNKMNKIGLYLHSEDKGTHSLITEYNSKWVKGQDIECFEAFTTDAKTITGYPFSKAWLPCWNSFENADANKIGYCLTFTTTSNQTITKTITKPKDTEEYKDYIELYIYDDVHQTPGVWYTHLSESDVTADTYMTSIKLTAGVRIAEVKDIKLSAFTYSSSKDFDATTGKYIGKNVYEISVKNQ